MATNTRSGTSWDGTVFLTADTIEKVKTLRDSDGIDLDVWGSADFVQSLLKHDLVDQLNLFIYPVVLGKGKKLFAAGLPSGQLQTHQTYRFRHWHIHRELRAKW